MFRDTRHPFRNSGQAAIDTPLTGSYGADVGYAGPVTGFRTGVNIREPIPLEGSESISSSFDALGMRIGYGLGGGHGFNLLGRGFEPGDADLKIGPLFFKLRALTGSVLVSDNINASETNREAGSISIVQLSATVVAQLTETLRLAANGQLVWLPFKGKLGVVADSGVYDFDFDSGLFYGGFPVAQLAWDGRIGEWDVSVTDTLYTAFDGGLFGAGPAAYFHETLFDGPRFDEFDQAGRYRYGVSSGGARNFDQEFSTRDGSDVSDEDFDFNGFGNRLDIAASRLLPGPIRLRVRAYREDLWYNQGERGLPTIREGASIFAGSERENMRFNPYAQYSINRTNIEPEWDQLITVGLRGPITDQLFLSLYAGEFIDGPTDQNRFVTGMNLFHLAGPFTYESLFIGREIDDYYGPAEVVDRISYNIHQVLGPRLFGEAFASYEISSTLDDSGYERARLVAGLRLISNLGPRTNARLSYIYYHAFANDPKFLFPGEDRFDDANYTEDTDYVSQTIRLDVYHRFTDTIRGSLYYAYRDIDSNIPGESYYENLVVLSLSKYFY